MKVAFPQRDGQVLARAIRAQLHVGQPRAQRLRDYLATGAASRAFRTEGPTPSISTSYNSV